MCASLVTQNSRLENKTVSELCSNILKKKKEKKNYTEHEPWKKALDPKRNNCHSPKPKPACKPSCGFTRRLL